MKVLTFAWVRTQTGEAVLEITTTAATAGDLLDQLIATRPTWQGLAARRAEIRFAVDQRFVEADAPLEDAHEVAFFPPVTGG